MRFILMNSFSTSDDTKEHLRKKHGELIAEEDSELVQNKSPKVDAKTLKPAEYPSNRDQEWCDPAGSPSPCTRLHVKLQMPEVYRPHGSGDAITSGCLTGSERDDQL